MGVVNVQERLFVCGSFCKGMVHFSKIESFVSSIESAATKGSVYRLEVGFPVFMNSGDTPIQGQIFSLHSTEITMGFLDEFHGYSIKNPEKSLHFRTVCPVVDSSGQTLEVLVYSLNPAKLPKSARLISDGNWQQDFETTPPMTIDLTERQRSYVQRLGSSSGRDIVPINLELYRELMNKGLIVDKGRRLALTRLGLEVYKYI